jgi:2-dehydro-3-deoxyphosphogluconate aldolase / (4S)-4-hydroxy-2-oxoglutarate aldolase
MSTLQQLIPNQLEQKIGESGIIAVLVIDNPDLAVPLAKTLFENGIQAMELTLRTDTALESLRRICSEVPEMLAGVGTILSPMQISEAQSAGAAFGVAPGYNRDVVAAAAEIDFPFGPGISTPSEIEGAVSQGCRVLKYFHAEGLGGTSYLKGINAPYGFLNLKYIPLGGLKKDNIRPYLEMPEILALGGSWIAPQKLIQQRNWAEIGKNAVEAMKIFREVRG